MKRQVLSKTKCTFLKSMQAFLKSAYDIHALLMKNYVVE